MAKFFISSGSGRTSSISNMQPSEARASMNVLRLSMRLHNAKMAYAPTKASPAAAACGTAPATSNMEITHAGSSNLRQFRFLTSFAGAASGTDAYGRATGAGFGTGFMSGGATGCIAAEADGLTVTGFFGSTITKAGGAGCARCTTYRGRKWASGIFLPGAITSLPTIRTCGSASSAFCGFRLAACCCKTAVCGSTGIKMSTCCATTAALRTPCSDTA